MSLITKLFAKSNAKIIEKLEVDMHSHLLPGLDDGSPDLESTIQYLRNLQELGFRKVITTPHVMTDLYPNTPTKILEVLKVVQEKIAEIGLQIKLEAAAEYMIDENFDKLIDNDAVLPIAGKYLLVELSYVAPVLNYESAIFKVQARGFVPILAHPERYYYFSMAELEHLHELGCLFQINVLSLTGYYGKHVSTVGHNLLQKNMVSLLGTDLHHKKHLEALKRFASDSKLNRQLSNYEWLNPSL